MPEIVADNISIINSSELEGATRIDAEYYQPEYLRKEKAIKQLAFGYSYLKTLLEKDKSISGGATPLGANYKDKGVPFLRVQNVMPNYLDLSDVVYIDNEIHERLLKRSQIKQQDVLLTITGVSYGKSCVYPYNEPANINQHSVLIRTNQNRLLPEFLSTFLNCKYGKYQNDRKITGMTRPGLLYSELKYLLVPNLSNGFQKDIQEIVKKATVLIEKSKGLYFQAETLLLEQLGLSKINFDNDICCEVNSGDTITVNRIDAEYYQPQYEQLIKALKKYPCQTLGQLCKLVKGIEPGGAEYCEKGKPFIRVSNLTKHEINNDNQQYLSEATYKELKEDYQPRKGEILLSKDATPGITYHLKNDIECIVSSGILRLQLSSKIRKEYLCSFLNSMIGQMQIQRDAGGSIINHWKPEQVRNTVIPILPGKVQDKIEQLCLESFTAREKSKQLLTQAKQKVEDMIDGKCGNGV
ncbi:MAG: restriction endonuclease subunit S [Elusimicrobiota bacterium]